MIPEYCRPVPALRGITGGALAVAVPQGWTLGWTQGTRPASSSAMILPVISSQRPARSWPGRAEAVLLDIADLRDGRRRPLLQPSTRHGKPGPYSHSMGALRALPAEGGAPATARRRSPMDMWTTHPR